MSIDDADNPLYLRLRNLETAQAKYIERIDQHGHQVEARFVAGDRALDLALVELQRRLDLLNEFRGQAAEESALFARKESLDVLGDRYVRDHDLLSARVGLVEGNTITHAEHEALTGRILTLETAQSALAAKAASNLTRIGVMVAGLAVFLTILVTALNVLTGNP